MNKTICPIAMSIAFVFAIATVTAAEITGKTANSPVDVSGIWNLSVEFSGGSGSPVFTFKQAGEQLTGRYVGALGEADVTGTIKDHEIRFGFTIAGQNDRINYVGTVDGDAMKGKVSLGSLGDGTFTGKKQPKK